MKRHPPVSYWIIKLYKMGGEGGGWGPKSPYLLLIIIIIIIIIITC